MTRFLPLSVLMALSATPTLTQPTSDPFPTLWRGFATSANQYIESYQNGVNNTKALRDMLHTWRKLNREQGWDGIK